MTWSWFSITDGLIPVRGTAMNEPLADSCWQDKLTNLLRQIRSYDEASSQTISLVASANSVSPNVISLMTTDLLNRAAEGRGGNAVFPGLREFYEIERQGEQDVAEALRADFAELRPISGSQANMIVLAALTEVGDTILTPRIYDGGHVSMSGRAVRSIRDYRFVHARLLKRSLALDVNHFAEITRRERPKLVFLGGSVIIEAQSLGTMIEAAHSVGAVVVYDASHVAGLIACGCFPNPLIEGADLMTMTTCKTIPGPSHAWIVGRADFEKAIRKTVFPGFVSGGHLQEYVGALGAFYEILGVNGRYAATVVRTANLMGERLAEGGFSLIRTTRGHVTDTHQILCEGHRLYSAEEVQNRLEEIGILINANYLPRDNGFRNSKGLRLGTQEVVWLGAGEKEILKLADLINECLHERQLNTKFLRLAVAGLRSGLKALWDTSPCPSPG